LFPSTRSRAAALALAVVAAAVPSPAETATALFEVAGALDPAPSGLRVRVTVRNTGGRPAEDVRVHGELLGERAFAEITRTIPPGTSQDVLLSLPQVAPTTGVHALAIRLDYDSVSSGSTPAAPLSQWAYLLLAFGPSPLPALTLELPRARFSETARLPVTVRSADGRPHRVRLSLYVPRGLGAVPHRQTIDVPATGQAVAHVRLYRALAAPHTSHGLLALAVVEDEDVVRTVAAVSLAEVGPDAAILPRARRVLLIGAGLLAAAGAVAQWRRR
jgi:hypothetical protein